MKALLKRSCCILFLLSFLYIPVHAAHEINGVIGRSEYKEPMQLLISTRNESNNNVSLAYLFLDVSEPDYSIYVGIKYVCEDVHVLLSQLDAESEEEPAEPLPMTGVELSVNDKVCATAWYDGTFTNMDRNLYDADSYFWFTRSITEKPETNNFIAEIRLGLKYWMPHDSVLGIRVYDCSGDPSNYYKVPIYPTPTESMSVTQTKSGSTVNAQKDISSTTAASSVPKTTRRIITAAKASVLPDGTTGNNAPEKQPNKTTTLKSSASNDKKRQKTTTQKSSQTKTEPESKHTDTTQAKEPTATVPQSETLTIAQTVRIDAQKAIRLNSFKVIAYSVATALLTAAVSISIFTGMRSKNDPNKPQPTPEHTEESAPDETEPDDDF